MSASGFTIIEVTLALFIFLMMTLMFAAVVPTAARNAQYANTYAYAASICQRKLDQLTEAGWDKLDQADLQNLGIIDNTPATTDGAAVIFTFTNNTTSSNANNPDNLDQLFSGGTNSSTRPVGTIRIEPWATTTIAGTPTPVLSKVTVTISWRDGRGVPQSFSIITLMTKMSLV
jgi:Tfp pilus assembly protein PilV